MISVWYGTPNEMTKAASKASQSAAVKWARDHLMGLERQAIRYDSAALERIRSTREAMLQCTEIAQGDVRAWQFNYTSVQFRIEIRHD